MPGGDADSGEVTARSGVAETESGGITFWAMLDNFTCKSRTNPAGWSPNDYGLFREAMTVWRWDPLDGAESYWAYLALIRLGHNPTKPFFKHVFPKLKALGRLRGIKKDVFFDKLSLPHLERLKPHLNSDELLSMAIHFEAHEWLYNHPNLVEGSTAAQARADQKEAERSPTASTASTQSTSEDHKGFTPHPAASALGEGEGAPDHDGRASGGQYGGARKRKGAPGHDGEESDLDGQDDEKRGRGGGPGPDEQHLKKRRLVGGVKQEEAETEGFGATGQERTSIFIYDDDDSDVL